MAATPEELVRQKLIHVMISQLGYPKHLLSVEMQISQLPHLCGVKGLPTRRIDLLCFGEKIHAKHPLFPLLMIECKEKLSHSGAREQVLGYNHHVQAPFVAVADEEGAQLVYPTPLPFLPTYQQLKERACN